MLDIAANPGKPKNKDRVGEKGFSPDRHSAYGGRRYRNLEDIEMVLGAGADRVSMNSAVGKESSLIKEAAHKFGSDRITVAIDARRNHAMASGFELVVAGGTKPVSKDAVVWARECEQLGLA